MLITFTRGLSGLSSSSVPCYQDDGGRPIRIVKHSKITAVGGSSAPVCSTSHVETIPARRPRIPS